MNEWKWDENKAIKLAWNVHYYIMLCTVLLYKATSIYDKNHFTYISYLLLKNLCHFEMQRDRLFQIVRYVVLLGSSSCFNSNFKVILLPKFSSNFSRNFLMGYYSGISILENFMKFPPAGLSEPASITGTPD